MEEEAMVVSFSTYCQHLSTHRPDNGFAVTEFMPSKTLLSESDRRKALPLPMGQRHSSLSIIHTHSGFYSLLTHLLCLCTGVGHRGCLRSMRYHTVCELGKGLEIETHKDTQTETWVILETGMLQECPLYCVQGQLI